MLGLGLRTGTLRASASSEAGYNAASQRGQLTVQAAYNIVMVLGAIVALAFAVLVFLTGKGDAMSGGSSSVRTTFKGKASFDDFISKLTLILGGSFLALMLVLDTLANRMPK